MTGIPNRRLPGALLAIFCLLPAAQTAVSIYWQWHTPITYPAMKGLMIAVPIIVWLWMGMSRKDACAATGWKRTNFMPGLAMGVLMAGVILGGYYALLRGAIDPQPIADKVQSMGLMKHYWLMAAGVCLWNSLFEEYYWRAFLVSELRRRVQTGAALCILCGAMFSLHHIFALASAFDWQIVALGIVATGSAGAVWTLMRLRGLSIFDCYVSHILADVAIMWIGYDLILQTRQAGV